MFKIVMLANLLAIVFASDEVDFEEVYSWNLLNYNWLSIDDMVKALDSGKYIPKNNVIIGMKVWKDKMYLTIPRVKKGVPVTLAATSVTPLNGITNPLLDPYPNWEMQTEGNCNAFQFVKSMEIDPLGRMWIIDTGRTETNEENPRAKCPPRLVILDLENGGKILRTYVFPNSVAPRDSVSLNDIAIDHEDGGWAYITDSENPDPGLIVYSLKDNASWKVRSNHSMRAQPGSINFYVGDTEVTSPIAIDGIALSPPGHARVVYYSPASSYHLYSLPLSVLRDSSVENVDEYVSNLGSKISQVGGMVMSNRGVLYMTFLARNSIATWDSERGSSFTSSVKEVFTDPIRGGMPDTFAFDQNGHLWYTSNVLFAVLAGNVDINQPNYRVLKTVVNAKSYQYWKDGTAPKYPVISKAAHRPGGSNHCKLSSYSK